MGSSTPKQFASPSSFGQSNQNISGATSAYKTLPQNQMLSLEGLQAAQNAKLANPYSEGYGMGKFGSAGGGGGEWGLEDAYGRVARYCPAVFCYVNEKRAAEMVKGDESDCLIDGKVEKKPLLNTPIIAVRPCVLLLAENGCSTIVSSETPVTLQNGDSKLASEMEGELVATDHGEGSEVKWEPARVIPVGYLPVAFHDYGGLVFASGLSKTARVYTHNIRKSGQEDRPPDWYGY